MAMSCHAMPWLAVWWSMGSGFRSLGHKVFSNRKFSARSHYLSRLLQPALMMTRSALTASCAIATGEGTPIIRTIEGYAKRWCVNFRSFIFTVWRGGATWLRGRYSSFMMTPRILCFLLQLMTLRILRDLKKWAPKAQ